MKFGFSLSIRFAIHLKYSKRKNFSEQPPLTRNIFKAFFNSASGVPKFGDRSAEGKEPFFNSNFRAHSLLGVKYYLINASQKKIG